MGIMKIIAIFRYFYCILSFLHCLTFSLKLMIILCKLIIMTDIVLCTRLSCCTFVTACQVAESQQFQSVICCIWHKGPFEAIPANGSS